MRDNFENTEGGCLNEGFNDIDVKIKAIAIESSNLPNIKCNWLFYANNSGGLELTLKRFEVCTVHF